MSIYYDTPRLALCRAGVLLRLRKQDSAWLQTVKRHARAESESTPPPQWQTPYVSRFEFSHIDDAELSAWLQSDKIGNRLVAIFESNLRRRLWQVTSGGARIAVQMDRGWLASKGRREEISELELQLHSGGIEDLYDLAGQLAQRIALPPLILSTAARGYRLYQDVPRQPVKAAAVALDASASPLAAFRLIAQNCLAHLQHNHAGACSSEDPEYVHQMRVATRRLRAAMRMFAPVLPAPFTTQLVPPLRELMGLLGRARDLDVLMAEIVAPVAAALPGEPRLTDLAGAITDRLYAARADTRHRLGQASYGLLLLQAGAQLHGPAFTAAAGADTPALLKFAARRLGKLLRRVRQLAAAAHTDAPGSLHELRIAIKRLRYAIEFFGPLLRKPGGARLLKRLAALQEELGQLNDLASAGTLLMACAGNQAHLREAVTLIGGWHGPRHAALLEAIPARLEVVKRLKLPHLRGS